MFNVMFGTKLELQYTDKVQDYEDLLNFDEEALPNEEGEDSHILKLEDNKDTVEDENDDYDDKIVNANDNIEVLDRPEILQDVHSEKHVGDELDADLDNPEEYDSGGCPVVPFAFSGMTGRLGNTMSTYVNFIALQWKLGYKYFLPKYMNHHTWADPAKPYLQSIFKNVTFPTASWSQASRQFRDAAEGEVILFNNSRTNYQEKDCEKEYLRVSNVKTVFSDLYKCAQQHGCDGKSCLACSGECLCTNIWVTTATGANFPYFNFIGSVLDSVIKHHLQFTDSVSYGASEVVRSVAMATDSLVDMVYIGVHVRRTDFDQFSKFWIRRLVNETYFEAAMDHFRTKHQHVVFLVVSDDMAWCKEHLTSRDTFHIGGTSPEVDMAIMARCNGSIIDYGTFGLWGAVLSGGEVVVTSQTFRDVRWAADFFGWTYI